MIANLITKEDFQKFKTELLEDLENLFNIKISEQKLWLRSSVTAKIFKIYTSNLILHSKKQPSCDGCKLIKHHELLLTHFSSIDYYPVNKIHINSLESLKVGRSK